MRNVYSIIFIVHCLHRLSSMFGREIIIKKLISNTLHIEGVNYLPPCFDGNRMFVFSLLAVFPLIPRPNPWTAWTSVTTTMFGPRPKPPISATT